MPSEVEESLGFGERTRLACGFRRLAETGFAKFAKAGRFRQHASGVRSPEFPGMKIVPALAIVAIIWILAHATALEFEVTGIVLAIASALYFVRAKFRRAS